MPALLPDNATVSACDINTGMIEWNKLHIPAVQFSTINHHPPIPYPDEQFTLI
jgi:hypothetical protein